MKNGTIWADDCNRPIQAHGGCVLQCSGIYYWYGEHKGTENLPGKRQVPFVGISCYSSSDLKNWHYEGLVLAAQSDDSKNLLHTSRVCERPKVLYNEKNHNFVLWLHLDNEDYSFARAGVAVSDSPTGPFTFLGARHVNCKDCRDMTLFQDTDGKAYLVHSSDWNKTLYISQLDNNFTNVTGLYEKALIDQEREAPALLFWKGKYYMVSSGCTGWQPNSALYAVSNHLLCGWKLIDNPCSGENYRRTFEGQSAHIFVANGQPVLLLDHWKPENLQFSGYSMLPITINGDFMEIEWRNEFELLPGYTSCM